MANYNQISEEIIQSIEDADKGPGTVIIPMKELFNLKRKNLY